MELDFQAEPPLTIASGSAGPVAAKEIFLHQDQFEDRLDGVVSPPHPRKVICFPAPAIVKREAGCIEPELELIQTATETPRILDVSEPEQIALLPSFADIRLDSPRAETSPVGELDLTAQPAALGRRLGSGLVDGAIVLGALLIFVGLFAAALSLLAGDVPRSRPALLCTLAAGALLSLLFEYLFLVYGKGTPGMSAASLELLTFGGLKPSHGAYFRRAMATILSGVTLGLGFAWALVDEDTLGWHDRMSGTYLKSSGRSSAVRPHLPSGLG
jgi:uncharacterized RDD family membrane protein YckC